MFSHTLSLSFSHICFLTLAFPVSICLPIYLPLCCTFFRQHSNALRFYMLCTPLPAGPWRKRAGCSGPIKKIITRFSAERLRRRISCAPHSRKQTGVRRFSRNTDISLNLSRAFLRDGVQTGHVPVTRKSKIQPDLGLSFSPFSISLALSCHSIFSAIPSNNKPRRKPV